MNSFMCINRCRNHLRRPTNERGTTATCKRIRVNLSDAELKGLLPWWGSRLPLPAALVELPRESLSSQLDGRNNPSCW